MLCIICRIRAETHSGEHNTTVALLLKSNPSVGVGVSGQIKDGQLEKILGMLRQTVAAIDLNAERFAADPVPNQIDKAI